MKYIRTGSEIYDTDDLYVCEELADKPYATKNGYWCIYKESIIKEADTIEELCDEFVILFNGTKSNDQSVLKNYQNVKTYFRRNKRYRLNHIKEIYGAIWTDKGLIYVAKMNDKGELELL